MSLSEFKAVWHQFRSSAHGRRLLRLANGAFVLGIIAYLVVRLTQIGWSEVIAALPTQPLFYVLILCMYLTLPIAEMIIYSRLWNCRPRSILLPSLRKRVLNADVLGYTGEIYLHQWARKRTGLKAVVVAHQIKDNLILSSAASLSTGAAFLATLIAFDLLPDSILPDNRGLLLAAGIGILLLGGIAVLRLRKVVISVPGTTALFLFCVHVLRFLSMWVLVYLHWWIVIPDASADTLLTLLGALTVTNRIPFLPSKDLIFVGVGTELSAVLGMSMATVSGMLLVRGVIDKVLNVGLFALLSFFDRHKSPGDDYEKDATRIRPGAQQDVGDALMQEESLVP